MPLSELNYTSAYAIALRQKPLGLGVGDEKIPQDVVGVQTAGGVELGIVRDLAGHIHGRVVPVVGSAHQFVELHFRIGLAIRGILLDHRSDVAAGVAQWSSGVKGGATISQRAGPIVERLLL